MKVLYAVVAAFLVGCSGAPATDAESSAGGTPSSPDFVVTSGSGGNPCGVTYRLELPNGKHQDVVTYCPTGEVDDVPDIRPAQVPDREKPNVSVEVQRQEFK